MWLISVPRMAREVASFAQDVRWLVDMAREACRAPPKPPEPETEMATNFTYSLGKRRSPGPVNMRPGTQAGPWYAQATTPSTSLGPAFSDFSPFFPQ